MTSGNVLKVGRLALLANGFTQLLLNFLRLLKKNVSLSWFCSNFAAFSKVSVTF